MDWNRQLVPWNDNQFYVAKATPSAFAGATTNARGGFGETNSPLTLFTVTGDVAVRLWGICTVNLASSGAANIEVGTSATTAGLIAQTTATDIDANDIWHDASPDANIEQLASIAATRVIANGADIIETISADVQSGQIYYVCLWAPVTPGSSVVYAGDWA